MRYHVKVNDYVLEEVYAEADIRGYAPGWREYQADVEVAPEGTQEFISLARFLGEPEPPPVPALPPGVELPPVQAYQPEPPPVQYQSDFPPPPGQEYGQPGFPGGWEGDYKPPSKTSMGLLGVGLGIVGLFCVPFFHIFGTIVSLGGLVVAIIALRQVQGEPSTYGGKGLAINGIVTSSIGLVVAFALIVVIPGMGKGLFRGQAEKDQQAQRLLREINMAQAIYESGVGRGDYADSLAKLGKEGLLGDASKLEDTPVEGFKAIKFETMNRSSTSVAGFLIVIAPVDSKGFPRSGEYSYFLDQTGVIRRSIKTDDLANASCPPMVGVADIPLTEEEQRRADAAKKDREIQEMRMRELHEREEELRRRQQMEEADFRRRMGR